MRNLVKESHWNATHRKQLQLPRARLTGTAELHGAASRTHISDSNPLSEKRAVLQECSHFTVLTFAFPVLASRGQLWHIKKEIPKKHGLELRDLAVLGVQFGPDQRHRPTRSTTAMSISHTWMVQL